MPKILVGIVEAVEVVEGFEHCRFREGQGEAVVAEVKAAVVEQLPLIWLRVP
jgi:hypothetical protein